ncbi:hypothetical protein [Amycolatopsis sp. NBC_00438]|uniref:hypothetical protein n=1 Tax=Amycolatopsis sp. NBC_00438 TaxID=2903558 RepID=UPI002E1E6893
MDEHASSFGAVAYAEHRPGYPEAAVRWARLWNVVDDRVGWVAGPVAARRSARVNTPAGRRTETAGFGSEEWAEFPHGQRRTAESLVAALATRAGIPVMPEPEREATLGRIRAYLASRPETAAGAFTLPLLTGVLQVTS